MGKAYSLDLRQKVLLHFEEYKNKTETARIFKISRNTITKWCNRFKMGILTSDKTGPKVGSYKKVNPEEVCKYLEFNKDSTLVELAEVFNVSHVAVWKILRKCGYVTKKNFYVRGKRRGASG